MKLLHNKTTLTIIAIVGIFVAIDIQKVWDTNENYKMNLFCLAYKYILPHIKATFNDSSEEQTKSLKMLSLPSVLISKWEILLRLAYGKDVADASFDKERKSHVIILPEAQSHKKIICACPQKDTSSSSKSPKLPLILHFHPGGLIFESADGFSFEARYIAVRTNSLVCTIDYSLSPQYPFPAALNDAVESSLTLIGDHYHNRFAETCQNQIDTTKIATYGISAGGYLSAHVARILSTQYNQNIAVQVSRVPMVMPFGGTRSLVKYWNAPLWDLTMNTYAWSVYLGAYGGGNSNGNENMAMSLVNDFRVNLLVDPPENADIEKLPPAYVQISTKDVLRDEGEMYASRLKQQGKLIDLDEYNTNHMGGFYGISKGGPGEHATDKAMEILIKYLFS